VPALSLMLAPSSTGALVSLAGAAAPPPDPPPPPRAARVSKAPVPTAPAGAEPSPLSQLLLAQGAAWLQGVSSRDSKAEGAAVLLGVGAAAGAGSAAAPPAAGALAELWALWTPPAGASL
jgi:hypothetical protein